MAKYGSELRLRHKFLHVKQQLDTCLLMKARLDLTPPKVLLKKKAYYIEKIQQKQNFLQKLEYMMTKVQEQTKNE